MRNIYSSIAFLSIASVAPVYAAPIDDANAAYDRGAYITALRIYSLIADQGDAQAQTDLAEMYYNGRGVTQNYAEAVKWYRLAAKQGLALAQSNLAVMYDNGQGVKQNFAEAVKWYRLAAEQGMAAPQYNLGVMYDNGQGVTQNFAEAVKWYALAAEQGLASAQYNLGLKYALGQGVPRNDAEAVRWYRLAAGQGDASAQNNLAVAYDYGRGVPQNRAEAVKWYRLAADQGVAEAQSNLGKMYDKGKGVQQNYAEAAKWFWLAAKQGNADAQDNLGMMFTKGHGVAQNYVKAHMWFNLSASSRLSKQAKSATDNLEILSSDMTPEQIADAQRLSQQCLASKYKNCDELIGTRHFSETLFAKALSGTPKTTMTGTRVALVKESGTYSVPAVINGVITLQFTIDSGSSDVTIPAGVATTLIKKGTVRDLDFRGDMTYRLADGSTIKSKVFIIRSLKVGDRTLTNVKASISNEKGDALLGQSFLERFKFWAIDNTTHDLVLQ